jgi:hypothetical protein
MREMYDLFVPRFHAVRSVLASHNYFIASGDICCPNHDFERLENFTGL